MPWQFLRSIGGGQVAALGCWRPETGAVFERLAGMDLDAGTNGTERPRERLVRAGVAGLSDCDLLALVLGHGQEGRPVIELARSLLRDVGGVHGLTRVSPARLTRVVGIGEAKASRVLAAIELGRRTLFVAPSAKLPMWEPGQITDFLVPRFGAYPTERFGVLLLDSRHRLMRVQIVSEGGIDAALAIPRDVFREAAIAGASAVVAFHNHPSGDVSPTEADVRLTRRLAAAGKIVGIDVVDHFILADATYSSMRKAGVISWRG